MQNIQKRPTATTTYTYVPQPVARPVQPEVSSAEGIWEKYKIYIISAGFIVAGVALFWYMKKQQEELENQAKKEKMKYRLQAERYAQQLAREQLEYKLQNSKGVRHDIRDPGKKENLAYSHEFEKAHPVNNTNEVNQEPSSEPDKQIFE